MTVEELGKRAKATQVFLSQVTTQDKNKALVEIANALVDNKNEIIKANQIDLKTGKRTGLNADCLTD